MKFMTWTLSRPDSATFSEYAQLASGEPWYSKNYVMVNKDATKNWGNRSRSFVETIEQYPHKFYAIGMHEFGVSDNGDIFNMGYNQITYPNGYKYNNPNMRVLNDDETDIERPVPTSLRYLMHKYPEIRWSLQFLATSNKSGDRVTPILKNERKPLFTAVYTDSDTPAVFEPKRDANGNIIYVNAQDEFIRQAKRIAELYLQRGFPIADIEIDMEKTRTVEGEWDLFAQLLARVKREICLPLNLKLRVNLFAMTGDYNPSYYAWHDYRTIARANVDGVQAVDEFQLMTYDFSWGGSAPGTSTPLWWLENVLKHVKALADDGVWRTEQVFIGNAGYGRRWALGEERLGVTFDYKQMVSMQNGEYVHNDGETASDGYFHFRNQDFIPFAGYNDPESDYQINYMHVYDRFWLSDNGGATAFNSINRPQGGNYVTSYSRKQNAIFTGVADYITAPTNTFGKVENRGVANVSGYKGLPSGLEFNKYVAYKADTDPETGEPLEGDKYQEGELTWTLSANGTYKLIAVVTFPFYDSAETTINVGGTNVTLSGIKEDWYPFIQSDHFYEVGEFNINGSLTITAGYTKGVNIAGFILCKGYDHGLTGGNVDFPVTTYPMKRRGNKKADGSVEIIDAQYPDEMRLVGEILRRPPRPAIIWEDIFASYVTLNGEGYNILNSGYYPTTTNGGFTQGAWNAYMGDDYSHAYVDSRSLSSQLVLAKTFSSNIMLECEMSADAYDGGVYGLRILAQEGKGLANGYLFLLDHARKEVRLDWEDPNTGATTNELKIPMSATLAVGKGGKYNIRAYYVNGKLSCWVNDKPYIDRYTPNHRLTNGAYGIYANGTRLKVYKYNISSLDRFERMERMEVTVEGHEPILYGEVARNVPVDEYGLLVFTGYPADISEQIKEVDGEGGSSSSTGGTQTGTILDTEVTPEDWSLDYKNKTLADVTSWRGKRIVNVRMVDAGIWFRRFYVGDKQGMSIAYNSDKIGFIRTANMVSQYKCKGIAMWTLGQEDPTIYTYLPDSN